MKNLNLENVQEAAEYKKVTPGGYVCGITSVKDVTDKEYLKIEYEIAEGEFKGYYRELEASKGFWGASFIKSYKESALPFFKAFITSVEKSNNGFKFANDETKLRGKYVGLVLGEEEYRGNDGSIKTRLYVDQVHSVDKIKSGDFKVPAFKPLSGSSSYSSSSINEEAEDSELPFN